MTLDLENLFLVLKLLFKEVWSIDLILILNSLAIFLIFSEVLINFKIPQKSLFVEMIEDIFIIFT